MGNVFYDFHRDVEEMVSNVLIRLTAEYEQTDLEECSDVQVIEGQIKVLTWIKHVLACDYPQEFEEAVASFERDRKNFLYDFHRDVGEAVQIKEALDRLKTESNPEKAERMLDDLEDALPYTTFVNTVIDKIYPEIWDTDKAILGYVLRWTRGCNKQIVRIATSEMMRAINKGRTAVNNARRRLIAKGYLIVVERGTGLQSTLYKVCLYPEIRKQMQQRAKALEDLEKREFGNGRDTTKSG